MYNIVAQPEKNLIILQLEGFVKDDKIEEAVQIFRSEVDKLSPGFSVVNDVSRLKPVSQKGTEMIRDAQQYAVKKGMGRVVRVVADELVKNQWKRKSSEAGYDAIEANSIEEAKRLLKEDKKS